MFFQTLPCGEGWIKDGAELTTGPRMPFTGSKPGHITIHHEMDQETAHEKLYTVAQCLFNWALLVFLIAEHFVVNAIELETILIICLLSYSTCSADLRRVFWSHANPRLGTGSIPRAADGSCRNTQTVPPSWGTGNTSEGAGFKQVTGNSTFISTWCNSVAQIQNSSWIKSLLHLVRVLHRSPCPVNSSSLLYPFLMLHRELKMHFLVREVPRCSRCRCRPRGRPFLPCFCVQCSWEGVLHAEEQIFQKSYAVRKLKCRNTDGTALPLNYLYSLEEQVCFCPRIWNAYSWADSAVTTNTTQVLINTSVYFTRAVIKQGCLKRGQVQFSARWLTQPRPCRQQVAVTHLTSPSVALMVFISLILTWLSLQEIYHLVQAKHCYFPYRNGNTKSCIFLTYHILKGLHSFTFQAQMFPQLNLILKAFNSHLQ